MPDDGRPVDHRPDDTTVLVVGGGPVGLLLSVLLDRQGVDHLVVERRTDVQPAPAAHVVNARTFEILRTAGVDMARVDAACQPVADGAWVRWVSSLTGEELGCVPFERLHQPDQLDTVTPTPLRNLSQHRLEPILRDHVGTSLATGLEWVGARVDGDVVHSELRRTDGTTHTVRSRFLVAADGAGSPVRRWAGIDMDGPAKLRTFLTIHVEADLRHLVAHRPATLYWASHPDNRGIFVAHDLDRTWVFMYEWEPDVEPLDSFTEQRCLDLFRAALGPGGADVDLQLRTVSPWAMTCQVADEYRRGPVLLAGDAAHRFPPTGGLGLNTGAADVHNLSWKLGAVCRGWAGDDLLDTYESERRPVALANATASLDNALRTAEVDVALGTTDDLAASRDNFAQALATYGGRRRVRAACEAQAGHFDMLGLQLGYRYDHGTAGGEAPGDLRSGDADAADPEAGEDDPALVDYRPTTRPGARLPHAWVEAAGEQVSTLDLVPADRYLLLTSSPAWVDAAADRFGDLPLEVALVGRDVVDTDGRWAAVSEVGADGAVLVRPDHHVAGRWVGPPPTAGSLAPDGAMARPTVATSV